MLKDGFLRNWKEFADKNEKGFYWDKGVLKRRVSDEVRVVRDVIVMPKEWRRRVLKLAHDRLGHVGSGKTCWSLRQVCLWPGIHRAVKKYVKGSHECQCLTKGGVRKAPMGIMPVYSELFRYVAVDIVGSFPRACGYAYLLTYVCLGSRYPEAIPLNRATAQECAKGLLDIFARNWVPDTILTDQGSPFM